MVIMLLIIIKNKLMGVIHLQVYNGGLEIALQSVGKMEYGSNGIPEPQVGPAVPEPQHHPRASATLRSVSGGPAAAPRGLPLEPSLAAARFPEGDCSIFSADCLLLYLELLFGSVSC